MGDMIQEVKDLMRMAVNWRKGYESWLSTDGDNEYVFEEFVNEVQEHLLPYMNRMVEVGALSKKDASALVFFYMEQVEYLKEKSVELCRSNSGPD